METTNDEKELLSGEVLQEKLHRHNQGRRFSKLTIYSIHGLFLMLVAVLIFFGSWLATGALVLLWGALVFSF